MPNLGDWSLLSLFRRYRDKERLVSFQFWTALLVATAMYGLHPRLSQTQDFLRELLLGTLQVSASMLGIVIAAVAIVLASGSTVFLASMYESGTLDQLLFAFLWTSLNWVAALLTAGLALVVEKVHSQWAQWGVSVHSFFFLHALLLSARLVGTITRYGLARGRLASEELRFQRSRERAPGMEHDPSSPAPHCSKAGDSSSGARS
ncbi:hypothetical protein [Geochorda subterranea]|uniref:Uncharacterized protein n=1 Tax=Geochorda subterranea TaxID=3109564 RepID=A0ABZ1BMD8_9FIRM|nr:hypothetical protein [Limnochorda sp. LNt]WRP13716.1 hypothetical protein VLY81_09720 [Limnochorda sp. LNt]